MDRPQGISYLVKNKLLHIDMLEILRRKDTKILYSTDRGILIYNEACDVHMISAQDEQTVAEMLSGLRNPQVIVTHQNCYVATLQKQFSFQEKTICHQTAYLKKVPLPVPKTRAIIRPLDETYLPFVLEHYTHAENNEPYVLERLKSGAMFGAYIENRLAGFIGTHAEGAMGMLEVLPEFRRRGIAAALETFLANRFLSDGKIPFAQIIAGNEASLKLHEKLNFSVTDLTLCWLS